LLPKKFRLTKKEFEYLRSSGHVLLRSPIFVLVWCKAPALKFGISISAKVDKRAVYRNKVKRVLWDAVKFHLEKFPKGNFYGFLVKQDASKYSDEEINDLVNKAISKVSIS